jgi:hypothetical protein
VTTPPSAAPRTPEDVALARRLEPLSPTAAEVERIGRAVSARLAAARPSLAAEWWGFLRARPWVNVPAALAAAAVLLAATPLGALPALLGRLAEGKSAASAAAPAPAAEPLAQLATRSQPRP